VAPTARSLVIESAMPPPCRRLGWWNPADSTAISPFR